MASSSSASNNSKNTTTSWSHRGKALFLVVLAATILLTQLNVAWLAATSSRQYFDKSNSSAAILPLLRTAASQSSSTRTGTTVSANRNDNTIPRQEKAQPQPRQTPANANPNDDENHDIQLQPDYDCLYPIQKKLRDNHWFWDEQKLPILISIAPSRRAYLQQVEEKEQDNTNEDDNHSTRYRYDDMTFMFKATKRKGWEHLKDHGVWWCLAGESNGDNEKPQSQPTAISPTFHKHDVRRRLLLDCPRNTTTLRFHKPLTNITYDYDIPPNICPWIIQPNYLTACTMIKGDNVPWQTLPEWVAYYLLMGVQQFYIYINDDVTSLQQYAPVQDFAQTYPHLTNLVHWLPFPDNFTIPFEVQDNQLHDCLYRAKRQTNWIVMNDVDEFFHLVNYPATPNLTEYLKPFDTDQYASVQGKNWFFMDPEDHHAVPLIDANGQVLDRATQYATIHAPNRTFLERFPYKIAGVTLQGREKSIYRPHRVDYTNAHVMREGRGQQHIADPHGELYSAHYKYAVIKNAARINPITNRQDINQNTSILYDDALVQYGPKIRELLVGNYHDAEE